MAPPRVRPPERPDAACSVANTGQLRSLRSSLPTCRNAAENNKYVEKTTPRLSAFIADSSPIASVVALYNSAGLITTPSLEEVAFVSRIPLLLSTIDVVGRGKELRPTTRYLEKRVINRVANTLVLMAAL